MLGHRMIEGSELAGQPASVSYRPHFLHLRKYALHATLSASHTASVGAHILLYSIMQLSRPLFDILMPKVSRSST